MERKLWTRLYPIIVATCQRISHSGVLFSDRWILLVYFWAVIHDRPTSWACQQTNWPDDLRPVRLPSQPTMSRRLRTAHVHWALALIMEQLRGDPAAGLLKFIDAKPLPVGGASKDPDAHWGRGTRVLFKGYKLFALWGPGPVPLAWEVRSADRSESTEADRLIPHLGGGGYLLGDAIYDCNRLYDLAMSHEHQLIAVPKRPGRGLGHCRQSPYRLRGLALLASPFGQELYEARSQIERDFAHLTSFGGGLSGLPSWVRRSGRVGTWVEAKLIINGIRALPNQPLTA
jgi:Transposase DDE domain